MPSPPTPTSGWTTTPSRVLSLPTAYDHYQLLTCEVSVPACRVAVPDLGEGRDDGGNGVGFVLPIGEPFFP